jgi:hypothetical protein
MRVRFRAIVLPAAVLGVFLFVGCGTANEEGLSSAAAESKDPNIPEFKTYGEQQQWKAKEDAKNRPDPKAKAGTQKKT